MKMKKAVLWSLLGYCLVVLVHSTDLNPIWLWPWYCQTIGSLILSMPFWLIVMIWVSPYVIIVLVNVAFEAGWIDTC